MPQAKVLLARAPDPQCPKWVRFHVDRDGDFIEERKTGSQMYQG